MRQVVHTVGDLREFEEPKWFSEPRNLSQFLSAMGHEVKTPLSSLLGFSDLMQDPTIGTTERKTYTEILTRNSHLLLEIVEDILTLAKMEAGTFKPVPSPISLVSMMADIFTFYQLEAIKKKIDCVLKSPPPDFPKAIFSDVDSIHQMLSGIIESAVKVTSDSKIIVSFEVLASKIGIRIEHPGQVLPGLGFKVLVSRFVARAMGGDIKMFQKKTKTVFVVYLNSQHL